MTHYEFTMLLNGHLILSMVGIVKLVVRALCGGLDPAKGAHMTGASIEFS